MLRTGTCANLCYEGEKILILCHCLLTGSCANLCNEGSGNEQEKTIDMVTLGVPELGSGHFVDFVGPKYFEISRVCCVLTPSNDRKRALRTDGRTQVHEILTSLNKRKPLRVFPIVCDNLHA